MRSAIARSVRAAYIAPVALAAALVLTAAPAAAQDLSKGAIRPAPSLIASREVATYRFRGGRPEGLPVEVTLVDRGGQLVATYRMPGEREAQPMMVTVLDMDLILQAETDKGVLTIQLVGQNDPVAGGAVTGRWTLGSRSGELRGQASR